MSSRNGTSVAIGFRIAAGIISALGVFSAFLFARFDATTSYSVYLGVIVSVLGVSGVFGYVAAVAHSPFVENEDIDEFL